MKIPSLQKHDPLIVRINSDRAPIGIFQQLYGSDPYAFLYESMENGKQRSRYTIAGGRPGIVFQARKENCRIITDNTVEELAGDPFAILEDMIEPGNRPPLFDVFYGGAVGYISYDAVRHIERLPDTNPEDPVLPEIFFIFPTEIIIIDHYTKTINVVCYGPRQRCQELVAILHKDHAVFENLPQTGGKIQIQSNMAREKFCITVKKAKDYIRKGDVFQVVLSQRFMMPTKVPPFSIYQKLRDTNPSPYMYFLKLDRLAVLGSSPETLIKLQNEKIVSVPIAGTRCRGQNEEEDNRLMNELLGDEKERAEHTMLVDLARNDVGHVSIHGSVQVPALMTIEKFSRVIHITSMVTGDLRPGLNAFDVFKASFPAGTVSGAPKVRAMEIIDELETIRRGIYAGAIGYFGYDGNMDFCIAIRTIVILGPNAYVQTGAGIVADSVPAHEYNETLYKMEALKHAMEIAS